MTAPNTHTGPSATIHTNRGRRISVLRSRRRSPPRWEGTACSTDPETGTPCARDITLVRSGVPLLEVGDRETKLARPEVRPERRRHPQLGVGDLPQEEIGQTQLPARADQQVRVGNAVGVERAGDANLVDIFRP